MTTLRWSSPTTGRRRPAAAKGDRREAQAAREHRRAAGECRAASITTSETAAASGAWPPPREVATTTATSERRGQRSPTGRPRRRATHPRAAPSNRSGSGDGRRLIEPLDRAHHRRRPAEGADAAGGDRLGDPGRRADSAAACDRPRYPWADARSSVRPAERTASTTPGPGARDRFDRAPGLRGRARGVRAHPGRAARSAARRASSWLIRSDTSRS